MNLLQSVMDASSHAMLIMDACGKIEHLNQQAKRKFGLLIQSSISHDAGKLSEGDIVILADTSVGSDDGALVPEDLAHIGIPPKKIKSGDTLIAVGTYRSDADNVAQKKVEPPVYKFFPSRDLDYMELETVYRGCAVSVEIKDRRISVTVNGTSFEINYFSDIAQFIIVEPEINRVRFWEELGYTSRREGAGDLLRGNPFLAKYPHSELQVIGHDFTQFFTGDKFEEHIHRILEGRAETYENEEYRINGFSLVASVCPVYNGDTLAHIIVKFRHIEDIRMTILERNDAIIAAEETYRRSELSKSTSTDEAGFLSLFGFGASSESARRQAFKLSQLDCNILITGESGTGKSFLAGAIKKTQPRKGAFVRVDCATIVPTLFESAMFGYVGGAFTGADPKGKPGFFEAADGGTIFLDEIGEIPLEIQTKLLNVIQNKTVIRVGSVREIPVDVRILAATNRDLKEEIASGRFRQDLYYRLSTFSIELPPLRESPIDVYFIINDLLEKIPQKYGIPKKNLSGEAFAKLTSYDWPGNIRELENVLESAIVLSETDIIFPEQISLESHIKPMDLKLRIRMEEKRIIQQTIASCKGNKVLAMEHLSLSKTAFYRKLKEYDIS
ncbi:MAG: sigma 54-interacting transcriptional regulator [Lachnospiraceae bacterium]|nr:sigma 54-interacting transcriptional regulator [Lachnospiraceae bacterium]